MVELTKDDAAPDFRLQDSSGAWVSMKDYAGRKLILYFYPAALTPGCTVEAIDFTQSAPAFNQAGYAIVGVSPDKPEKLERFITKHNLSITLLSDPDRTTLNAYGAWGERSLWGKVVTGVIRSTFVIDVTPQGTGTILEAQYGVRATGHVNRLRTTLGV
ncbi:MAG: peroxiredoxin [Propionibacteriaceae bacterium]|nr:peroxiredoxin [Propionibacteriaceae bacterium]